MPEFLTTSGISARLQDLIRDADEFLVLISPYLQTNPKIRELLEQKSRSDTHIRVIYGKRELRPEERNWIDSLPSIELCFRETLHAKCYLNEKEAILTSMNLYQFSEVHNDEWGIRVLKREEDGFEKGRLYSRIYREAEHIADLSEKIREVPRKERASIFRGLMGRITNRGQDSENQDDIASAVTSVADADSDVATNLSLTPTDDLRPAADAIPVVVNSEPGPEIPTVGFCIRCKITVPAKPAAPYCNRCYRTWNRYQNEEYQEKYCHLCGNEETTTMAKPLCWGCYRSYKDVFA